MATSENPYAGQGPVLLDIGGDIGALIVAMPEHMLDVEIEIRPAGATASGAAPTREHVPSEAARHADHGHAHDGHAHDDHPHDDHDESHGHGHGHGHSHGAAYPHVAVVARPTAGGVSHTLVYPEVRDGDYELVPIPGDEVAMTARVVGGAVTEATWPG